MEDDFGGNYLNVETSKNGDVGVVIDTSKPAETKLSQATKKQYVCKDIEVELNGKRLTYSIYPPVGKALQRIWGKDSAKWVGKKFNVLHVNYTSFGQRKQRVDIEPIDEKLK